MNKLKKVAVFAPPYSQYEVLQDFTLKLTEALKRKGVECEVIVAGESFPYVIEELLKTPPDCTLSFNGLLPDAEGRFLCDFIQIPHVACLVDSPIHYFPLIQSPLTITASVDRSFSRFFKEAKGENLSFFFPHAIDRNLQPYSGQEKKFDLLMLGTCLEIEQIKENWKKNLSQKLKDILDVAVEKALRDPTVSCMEAFISTFHGIDPSLIDFPLLLDQFETYLRGKDRIDMINNIDPALKIDIFGAGNWMKYIHRKNVVFHESVDNNEILSLIHHGKIALNSSPHIKDGSHERVLNALAGGAAVVTNENKYLQEQFHQDEGVRYYRHGDWDLLNQTIRDLLSNDEKRMAEVRKGNLNVRENHTWDNRAQLLDKELSKSLP